VNAKETIRKQGEDREQSEGKVSYKPDPLLAPLASLWSQCAVIFEMSYLKPY